MKTSCRSYLGIVFLIIARMAESQPVVIYAEDSFRRNQDATFRWNAISPSDLRSALPLISSICEKLSLSVPTPVITNQVARVRGVMFDSEGNRSLYVTLTNGFEFWVEHGTVIGFRSSKDVEGMGDTRLFHLAFGP